MVEVKKYIHQGKNLKRFRDFLGIKQERLAYELGDTWNQKKISLLEQKEIIEPETLNHISEIIQVPIKLLKNFDASQAIELLTNMLAHEVSESDGVFYYGDRPIEIQKPDYVPLLPLSSRARAIDKSDFNYFDSSYTKIQSPVTGADFATILSNDGLGSEFPDGAIAYFKSIDPELFIEWGKVYAVSTKNGLIIKRLKPGSLPRSLLCFSSEKSSKSFEILRITPIMQFYKAVACTSIK